MLAITLWVIITVIQPSAPVRMASAFWHLFDFIQFKRGEKQVKHPPNVNKFTFLLFFNNSNPRSLHGYFKDMIFQTNLSPSRTEPFLILMCSNALPKSGRTLPRSRYALANSPLNAFRKGD